MDQNLATPPSKTYKLVCSNVPIELLIPKSVTREHFLQFGNVVKITRRPKSLQCIVEYDSKESAEAAIISGGDFLNKTFTINWHSKSKKTKKIAKKNTDPEWLPDPEIQEELLAMAGTGNQKRYNTRPEGMVIDVPPKLPPSKGTKLIKSSLKLNKPKKAEKNVWTAEQLDLLDILKQSAITTDDKFKILDARDKLIRLRTKKHVDLSKAKATVGTCSDMCPEKERLMREIQHQVALYEQDPGDKAMNHKLAIKQYSRSSADQEVPLPHELRPVEVLQLTIRYLMHQIINMCDHSDVNLAEWYHFLWDRTRSIRKDITQQELCCQGSVELLEQCARFHIHCSARLIAEEPSVFDQKINTENLTKCLQTLKYMYHDLNLKGENCPHEAEFRAYVILLNLNDGNFMWEVQQLKLEIQKSPEVKFALDVHFAIDSNNFVKFFKLVKSTGYLNACILMRYFVQMRSNALETMLKSYSPRYPYSLFSVAELEKLLGFEDRNSTIEFITVYGLYMSEDQTQVILDRKTFRIPEVQLLLDRAIKIVESKRQSSVGNIVYGGILPPFNFNLYVPHNSFDENGVFIFSGVIADVMKDAQQEIIDLDESTKDEHDSMNSVPQRNLFQATKEATPPDSVPTVWSMSTQASTDTKNVFKFKSDSPPPSMGIFSSSKSKAVGGFTFKPPAFDNKEQKPIFSNQGSIGTTKRELPQKANIFGEQLKSNVFGLPPKPSVLQDQIKPIIFGEPQKSNVLQKETKSSIFGEPQKPVTFEEPTKSSIFGHPSGETSIFSNKLESNVFAQKSQETKLMENKSKPIGNIFGGPVSTSSVFTQQPSTNTFSSIKFISQPVVVSTKPNERSFDTNTFTHSPALPKSFFDDTKTAFSNSSAETIIFKPFVQTPEPKIKPAEKPKPIFDPSTVQANLQELEKRKEEELKKLRQLQKEKEEKLKRELEEKKRKEQLELEKKRKEEERKRNEAEKLERERLQRLEEERRLAILLEQKRKLEKEIRESVTSLMDDLLTKVEEMQKNERLKEIANKVQMHKLRLFTQKWRKKISVNKRKRRAMDQNPIWLPSRTVNEEAKQLFTDSQNFTLQNIKRYKFGKSSDVAIPQPINLETINVKHIYRLLLNSYMKIYTRPQKELFWKLTVSLPDYQELRLGLNVIQNVLNQFFQWKDRFGSSSIVDQYRADRIFTYCIEKKQGVHPFESNSNGLLFVSHEPTQLLYQRISKGLQQFPKFAQIPVAIILINNSTSSINTQNLAKTLESMEQVRNYDILACKFTHSAIINAAKQSLDFLAKFIEKPPPLELNLLETFLYENLAVDLWKRVFSYAVWNSMFKKCLRVPNIVINLYNEAIERLKDILFEETCLDYPDFADDLKLLMEPTPRFFPCDYKYFPRFWRDASYRHLLRNRIDSLKLPLFEGKWPSTSQADLEKDVLEYCKKQFKESQAPFYKILEAILNQFDPLQDFEKIRRVSWLDVIQVLALEKLTETDLSLRYTEFHAKSNYQHFIAVYKVESLLQHNCDEWFYLRNPLIEKEIQNIVANKPVKENPRPQRQPRHSHNLEHIDLNEIEESLKVDKATSKKKIEMRKLEEFMADLQESMEIHKKINAKFQETVNKALNN